jgi:membrane protease YdiL (CAAX protease family)
MSRVADLGARRVAGEAARQTRRAPRGYLQCSELPLASLLFLLPLIVVYEVGTWRFASDPANQVEQRIIAFTLLRQFFSFFGATALYLPPLAVVGLLLAWHLARRDPWRVEVPHLFGMGVESVILAIPLLAVGFVIARYIPVYALAHPTRNLIVLSIGAGIYEELIFRLIAFTVLSLLFIDVLGMRRVWAYLLMVVISSLMFSMYHYLGSEPFQLRSFAFRTGAGLYFGSVFAFRGFGITAGSHAAYDVCVVLLRNLA